MAMCSRRFAAEKIHNLPGQDFTLKSSRPKTRKVGGQSVDQKDILAAQYCRSSVTTKPPYNDNLASSNVVLTSSWEKQLDDA